MKEIMPEEPNILNAKDISKILRVSLRTAYYLMDNSDFPLIKIGRCKRVEREKFFAWVQMQTMKEKLMRM